MQVYISSDRFSFIDMVALSVFILCLEPQFLLGFAISLIAIDVYLYLTKESEL